MIPLHSPAGWNSQVQVYLELLYILVARLVWIPWVCRIILIHSDICRWSNWKIQARWQSDTKSIRFQTWGSNSIQVEISPSASRPAPWNDITTQVQRWSSNPVFHAHSSFKMSRHQPHCSIVGLQDVVWVPPSEWSTVCIRSNPPVDCHLFERNFWFFFSGIAHFKITTGFCDLNKSQKIILKDQHVVLKDQHVILKDQHVF